MSHCPLKVVLLGSCRLCWAGAALPVWFGHLIPSKVPRELHIMAEPPIFTLGGVGVLLPGLKPPRAARLSSVCCHFPKAQPNSAFPLLL